MSDENLVGGLAGRYATALFELADGAKKLDRVADDLNALKALIAENEDLSKTIHSPLFGRDQLRSAMEAILERTGVDDPTRRFVLVVADNRRLFVLPQIIDAYLAELARRRGEVTANVTAAQELSSDQQAALAEALHKVAGGKVKIDLKVDPELLGGMVVRLGSRMIDTSLKGKLERLQLAMKGVG